MNAQQARKLIISGKAPDNLTVEGYLDLAGCTSLTHLPDNLTIEGYLILWGCTALTHLPDNLQVRDLLGLQGCTALTHLPDNLTVEGSLDLQGCTGLTHLPENLTVGGSLDLQGCTALTHLPDNLTVGSYLYLGAGNENLQNRELPHGCKNCDVYWNGVQVTEQVAFRPDTLTANDVLNERNLEVRRIMIERMGQERFVELCGDYLTVLYQDTDTGGQRKLIQIDHRLAVDESMVFLQVICPSTAREYIIRVPPHMTTCHAAAAWVAGFDNPDEYILTGES